MLFPKVYLEDTQEYHGGLFERVYCDYYDWNFDEFVELFLTSKLHGYIDRGNPHFLCMCSAELLRRFLDEGRVPKNGIGLLNRVDMRWAGEFYLKYQWRQGIDGHQLVRVMPPKRVAHLYPTFHTYSLSRAIEEAISLGGA